MRQEVITCDVCGGEWHERFDSKNTVGPFVIQYAPHMKRLPLDLCESCNRQINHMIIKFFNRARTKKNVEKWVKEIKEDYNDSRTDEI